MRLAFAPYTLKFEREARTSRARMLEKETWYIKIWDERDPSVFGIGEAPLFRGLSAEDNDRYVYKLVELLANVAIGRPTDLSRHSSIQFGLEQAILDFSTGGRGIYAPSPFVEGRGEIVINGLIWMGNFDYMLEQIERKAELGFSCVKLKIGSIEWSKEIELLEHIRRRWSERDLCLRVDANGAFTMDNALPRLRHLAELGVHSIEQPIRAGHPELMGFLCSVSPLPIALDEELIGVATGEEKAALLDETKPAYIILKPALCGGFAGSEEWMALADERGIGYWVTSALESNVGLNAIAQWTASKGLQGPQGLGTGALFTNNFECPLRLEGDKLRYDPAATVDRSQFDRLEWRE